MRRQRIGQLVACIAALLLAEDASARIPPRPISLDVLLKRADRVVVGRVQRGSVKGVAGGDKKDTFRELTLLVTRSLDGKDVGKQITVTEGSFPAKLFPASKEHLQERFLLVGWSEDGHVGYRETGLELYDDQVWILERMREDRLRDPKTAPHGVDCLDAVQALEHAGLIELFARQASVAKLRQHIQKAYKGKIPIMAVQGLYGSSDPNAGALAWEHLQQYEATAKKIRERTKDDPDSFPASAWGELDEYSPREVFRTLNSLGRHEALKWARKSLAAATSNGNIYGGVLETFKRYQDTESVPRLLDLLKKADGFEQRVGIIATLGEIGDARAIPALIDALPEEESGHEHVRLALFQLTDVRLSPNGDYARRWWERNRDRPRWHWLKQGIEQDLYFLGARPAVDWGGEFNPAWHLQHVTCWRQMHEDRADRAAAWAKWWQANKDLPQERWILVSFKAVGHPLPDLASKEAVDALVKAYNTEPDHWWKNGPAIDMRHHAWCQRLLTRLTGWDIEDTHYLHSTRYYDYEKFGPLWAKEWRKSRYGVRITPIEFPERQPFTMAEEDRRLLCEDFASWQVETAFKGPLVRKQFPRSSGKSIVATFEITLTNKSTRDLTLHTKPVLGGASGSSEGFGSSLPSVHFECISHNTKFATLRPGESIRWQEQHTCLDGENDQVNWCCFRLYFQERGKTECAWRGHIETQWSAVKKENIREE